MKKGLHILGGFYINLENVCVWIVKEGTIHLEMNCSDNLNSYVSIILDTSDDTSPYKHKVPINEFKRIEREISEYMGV